MKDVKFRAWDKETKRMSIPKKLFLSDDNTFQSGELLINQKWNKHILMQFTGLKDAQGKEIYISDIITWGDINKIVTNDYIELATLQQGLLLNPKIKVIGNIYENPELLETNKKGKNERRRN